MKSWPALLLLAALAALAACASTSHPGMHLQEIAIRTPFKEPLVIQRPLPEYPQQAFAQRLEGQVLLHGTLSPSGTLEQVVITDSIPPGVFDQTAMGVADNIIFAIPPGWLEAHPGFEMSIQVIFELGPCGHIPFREQAKEKIRVCVQGAPHVRR